MRTPPTYSCDAPHAPGTPPNSPPAALHKKSCLHKKSGFCTAKLDSATSLAACRSLSLTCRTDIEAD